MFLGVKQRHMFLVVYMYICHDICILSMITQILSLYTLRNKGSLAKHGVFGRMWGSFESERVL